MSMSRREFAKLLAVTAASVGLPLSGRAERYYQNAPFGDLRIMHFTDTHAQLQPIYFREPSVNLGLYGAKGRAPHLVGTAFLQRFGIAANSAEAHAFTYLGFDEATQRFGKVGGYAAMKTVIDALRLDYGLENSLLLDGGDSWQGSATSLYSRGMDMVRVSNLLGVDAMTGHWEFTYHEDEIRKNLAAFKGEFLAQNIHVDEMALFDGVQAFDEDSGHAFKPYSIKQRAGKRIAVIGQAFPYVPIANPKRFVPNWSFGIKESALQSLVDKIKTDEKPDAIVLLSHNGMDVDIKLASLVSGIDIIYGGHTHDAVPRPLEIKNSGGMTLVTNAGSNGKFIAVTDFEFGQSGIADYRHRLIPLFSDLIEADKTMQSLIDEIRQPYQSALSQRLGRVETTLYRRGNFNGTFDQLICDALNAVKDTQISLSPGFRWGTTIPNGHDIRMDDLMNQTAITYPETYAREIKGSDLKLILEDVADNLFNADPFYQQGGDMVRVGGLNYSISPLATMGHRIGDMQLDDGSAIEADKVYKVSGWSTVGEASTGAPIWEVVSQYLGDRDAVKLDRINTPKLIGVEGNPGMANSER